MKAPSRFVACVGILLTALAAHATPPPCASTGQYCDLAPATTGTNLYTFRIVVPGSLPPTGATLQFEFATPGTQGLQVDYDFNGPGWDWTDARADLGIGLTVMDTAGAAASGWAVSDAADGVVSGLVAATAPLVAARLTSWPLQPPRMSISGWASPSSLWPKR